jgi:predicted outer membrane repeat protein
VKLKKKDKMGTTSKIMVSVFFIIIMVSWAYRSGDAAEWTVTNLNDSGPGSLRDAIAVAISGDTIVFDSSLAGTITTSAKLTISTGLTIIGPGASKVTVSGNHAHQVFEVASENTVSISDLTIANGYAGSSVGYGASGAAILLKNGTVIVDNCTFSGNVSEASGGAIYVFSRVAPVRWPMAR